MSNWIVAPPSRTPKFWGYSTASYAHVSIEKNNQTLVETVEASRHKYIEAPGQQNWGALDDREQVKNVLTHLDAAGNAMAYARSELTPSWTFIEPGTAEEKPRYQLDWLLEGKVAAPDVNPPIVAKSRTAVTGEIHHQFRNMIGEDDVDYALKMKVKLNASYEGHENAMFHPTLGGRMRMYCQNSYVEATYDPTIGANGAWQLVRHTLQSTGQYYDRTYTFPGRSFERVFSFYPVTTGNKPLFLALQVNFKGNPQLDDEGEWEGTHAENQTTFMRCDAGHATGLDGMRDDKWGGQIWIEPQAVIQH